MIRPITWWIAATLCINAASEVPVSEAIRVAQSDIASSVHELEETRERIDAARQQREVAVDTLAREVETLRAQVAEAREDRARQAEREADARAYRRELEAEWSSIEAQLREAARSTPTRLHPTEAEAFTLPTDLKLLTELARLDDRRLGGHSLTGEVLNPAGEVESATVRLLGPLAWAETPGGPAPLIIELNNPLPTRLDDRVVGPGVWPTDPTGGEAARQPSSAQRGWKERIAEGGPVMIPLIGVGVLALLLSIVKIISLLRIRPVPENLLDQFAEALPTSDAAAVAVQAPWPVDVLLAHAIEHRQAPPAQLEELLHERLLAMLPRLDRHLATLAVLAGVAPLLGLLGTVTGMIQTFRLITLFGSGDARMLSGGISEALSTTAVGLVIAVPVLLIHALLSRKVRLVVADLEHAIGGLITRLTREKPGA